MSLSEEDLLQMCSDIHLASTDIGLHLASLVHMLRHCDHDWGGLASMMMVASLSRLDNGHAPSAAALLRLVGDVPVELVLDVGHVLVHVAGDTDAGLVARAGDDGDHAGVLLRHLLGLLRLQRRFHRSPGEGEVAQLAGVASVVDGDTRGMVTRPRPVARRSGDLQGRGQTSPGTAIRGRRRHDGGRGRYWGSSTAIHQQQPQSVLLHTGLVGGRGRPVLELCVHHPRVGMRGHAPASSHAPSTVRRSGHEPPVPVVVVSAPEAQHGATRGTIGGGETPGDPRYRDQDDTNT